MNLTQSDADPEPYILTPEEEKNALEWEKKQVRDHLTWRMQQVDMLEPQIAQKLSEINWDEEIDREAILSRANSNKHYDIWQQKQRETEKQQEKDKAEELRQRYTAKKFYHEMRWTSENVYGKKFIFDDNNRHFITAVCYFLSNDPRFETELGYSLKKGLLIRGVSGLGKTHILKCVENNELSPILILSMIEITDEIKSEGEFEIHLGNKKIIYLDDVGTEEPTVNHFGTKISFFKNFIESYYLRNKVYNKLLISTNNNFSEIEQKYGFRVRSRMKDMFNIINVTGQDMRG